MPKRYIKLEELKPAPYNPRKLYQIDDEDWQALLASIEEHGMAEPVVWNEATGHIVGGHQRVVVAEHLGWKRLEVGKQVVVINEPDLEKEKRLNVRLNKVGQHEEIWDNEKLGALLQELVPEGGDSNALTGFTATEMAAVFADLDVGGSSNGSGEDDGGPMRSRKGEPSTADTKYVQLFFNGADFTQVVEWVKKLKARWELETPAEVCYRALEQAVNHEDD